MENYAQGIRSELKKVRSPQDNSLIRISYYTNIEFKINGCRNVIATKVDTGATHTVFGLKHYVLCDYLDEIQHQNECISACDASNTHLILYKYIVSDFKMTEDIIIPEIKVCFSEDIGEKAILGMDILSLFDFQYLKERNQNWGTFWINNYTDVLNKITKRKLNNDMNYIDPSFIAAMDGEEL